MKPFQHLLIAIIVIFLSGCVNEEASKPPSLTYWVELHPEAAKIMDSYNENEAYKAIQERTGISVEFLHPPLKQKREQFKLLIASGDLPDIIGSIDHLGGYPGGQDKAITDNVWLRLNDVIKNNAPNYQLILDNYPEIRQSSISPEGNITSFDMVMSEPSAPWQGMIIRKDWLDLLNLPVPETIDEWEVALTGFKDTLHVEAPLNIRFDNALFRSQVFLGAWDTGFCWINKEGSAEWGPSTEEYRSFLETFHCWYTKGLLDPEFAIRHDDSIERAMITGRMGACNVYYAWFDTFLHSNKDDPRYDLAGTPYPVLRKGQSLHLSHFLPLNQQNHTVITSSCNSPENAARFLDYGYSREGSYLLTYGIKDISYELIEGIPYFSDLILKNPENIPYNTIQYRYVMNHGPFLIDSGKDKAKKIPKKISQAQQLWSTAGHDWMWPTIQYSKEEAESLTELSENLQSYSLNMTIRFIMGIEPLSNWEKYLVTLEKLGLGKMNQIHQQALDRYQEF